MSTKTEKMLKTDKNGNTKLGRDLIAAGREVLAHVRGEIELETRIVKVPETIDVTAIRKRENLSQRKFADKYGFDVRTVQEWEQHRRNPDRAARILLKVIEEAPEVVFKVLSEEARPYI